MKNKSLNFRSVLFGRGILLLFVVLFLALGIVLALYLSSKPTDSRIHAEESATQPTAQEIVTNTKSQTLELLKLSKEYAKNRNQDTLSRITELAKQRKNMILQLTDQDPSLATQVVFSDKIIKRFPSEIQSYLEEEVTTDGTFYVKHSDTFNKEAKLIPDTYYLKESNNNFLHLVFTEAPTELEPNRKVRLKGVKVENTLLVKDDTNIQVLAARTSGGGTVTGKKLAVIMFNFTNDRSTPYTIDQVRSTIFDASNTDSVQAYYKAASYGKFTWTGDVLGWYELSVSNVNCGNMSVYNAWADEAKKIAQNSGANISGYDTYLYIFPPGTPDCYGSGWTDFGNEAWVAYYNAHSFIHELGHTLGHHHASGYRCTDQEGQLVPMSSICQNEEAQDFLDVMGYGDRGHFGAYHKGRLGWFDTPNKLETSSFGTYTIYPIERTLTGLQSLKYTGYARSSGSGKSAIKEYYYIYARGQLNDPNPVRVFVQLAPTYTTFQQPHAIDMTPGSLSNINAGTYFPDGYLEAGRSFVDSDAGLSIKTLATSSESATIQIASAATVCTQRNPTIHVTPSGAWADPGQPLTYTLTLTNSDSAACSTSTFAINANLPVGFVQSPPALTETLAPGTSVSRTITITSPVDSIDGFYNITEQATNTVGSLTGSASFSYNVAAGTSTDITPPSTSITDPLSGSRIPLGSLYPIQATANDNTGIGRVEFYINNSLQCTDTTAPYSCSWSVSGKNNVQYTLQTKAYDLAGNSGTSTPILITGTR